MLAFYARRYVLLTTSGATSAKGTKRQNFSQALLTLMALELLGNLLPTVAT